MKQSFEDHVATIAATQETPAGPAAPRRMTLNMGPQHPSTHGVLRIVIELEGETIMKAEPDIGFLHTGIEKQCEAINWAQVVTLTDRVDYLSNLANNLVYALTVEKLLQLEIPPKAQWLRVMLVELDRLNSHLVWLGTHALDIGAMSMFFYCFREREDVLRLKEMFSGQRMMTSYIRPGGVALEPPRGWEKAVGKFIRQFPSKVDEYENLLDSNPIWKIRTQGVGFISIEDMLDLGVTGPMLRAAGIPLDVRKTEPYSSYEKFDFKVATRTENDVYARYRVRMEEMRQSARIIVQAMEGMPEGAFVADAPHVVLPDREKMKTQMEALIYHFKIVTEGFRVPAGRGVSGRRIAARRDRLLHRQRWNFEALPRAHAHAELREPDGAASAARRNADRRFHRLAGQHGFRVGRYRPLMTFSPQLEERFAKMLTRYPEGRTRSAVVPMLIYAQDEVGAVTKELIEEVARRCKVTPLQVDEVVGYYSMLHRKPQGKFHVQVCTNISCLLVGGEELYEHAKKKLGIGHKETTADGQFSLEEVECMGACSWAPAVEINYDFHHFVTPEKLDQLIDGLRKAQ